MKYNNIPSETKTSSSDQTLKVFDHYYSTSVDLNNNELIAMNGFFEQRGFSPVAAETIALAILTQAAKDNYSGMQIMDTLSGLDTVEISSLVGEILNHNRFKTSSIGVAQQSVASDEVLRNIVP